MTADATALADICELLARRALEFGEIGRTACQHADGRPETDTTHTVMLAWLAPALAGVLYPDLDLLLTCAFAVVHDAVEVYAGDTSTLRPLTDWQRAAKAGRERQAVGEWQQEFGAQLPWLPAMIARYERQDTPEARYVRTVDKLLTGLVHFCNDARGLHEYGYTAAEHEAQQPGRYAQMSSYAADYPEILDIRREVSRRLIALLREREAECAVRIIRRAPAPELSAEWAARVRMPGNSGGAG